MNCIGQVLHGHYKQDLDKFLQCVVEWEVLLFSREQTCGLDVGSRERIRGKWFEFILQLVVRVAIFGCRLKLLHGICLRNASFEIEKSNAIRRIDQA